MPVTQPFGMFFVYKGEYTERKESAMDDSQIIDLYFQRSEAAITETDAKYGGYCYKIAYSILASREDSEESVNDTYLSAWKAMPPRRPAVLSTFLGRLTRNISIDRLRAIRSKKRGSGEMTLALEELRECVSNEKSVEDKLILKEVIACLNNFLKALPEEERTVFLCRYWYVNAMEEIGEKTGFSVSKVKSMLRRTRSKLGSYLEKEGLR